MSDTVNNTASNTVARLRELTVAVPYGMDTLLRPQFPSAARRGCC